MLKHIPIVSIEPLAVTRTEAALMLRISMPTLWRLIGRGSIKVTSYGRIPVSELQRHLQKEIA